MLHDRQRPITDMAQEEETCYSTDNLFNSNSAAMLYKKS